MAEATEPASLPVSLASESVEQPEHDVMPSSLSEDQEFEDFKIEKKMSELASKAKQLQDKESLKNQMETDRLESILEKQDKPEAMPELSTNSKQNA